MRSHAKALLVVAAMCSFFGLGDAQALAVSGPPTAEVLPAVEITDGTARLRARINPNGAQTHYLFEYGTSAAYGSRVPLDPASVGGGESPVLVSRSVGGLSPATTHHYRVVATNSLGQAEGLDRTFTTEPTPAACPNEAIRVAQGATRLPECRAWEMVSPLAKGGTDVNGLYINHNAQSAPNGNSMIYSSNTSFGDAHGGSFPNLYRARRGPAGWTTNAVNPPQETTLHGGIGGGHTSTVLPFSSDLSQVIVRTNSQLDPAATPFTDNLYVRNLETGAYKLLTPGLTTDVSESIVYHRDATPDYSSLAVQTDKVLTPDAPAGSEKKAYVFHEGEVELVSYLPGPGVGVPSTGIVGTNTYSVAMSPGGAQNAISDDGRYVFWQVSEFNGLYVRDLQSDITTEIVSSTGITFYAADPAGERALYTAGNSVCLYTRSTNTSDCRAASNPKPLAISEDLSSIYLSAGSLEGGEGVPPGSNAIYRIQPDSDEVTVVAPFTDGTSDQNLTGFMPDVATTRKVATAADGDYFAFVSDARITEYENDGTTQVYLFDAGAETVVCVSCPESAPSGNAHMSRTVVPTATGLSQIELAQPRAISVDGRKVFFQSPDRLLPGDSNSRDDVYMWKGGDLRLLSSGTGDEDTRFLGASASGDDVFIVTRARLSGHDTDSLADVYDIRVGGGYPEPVARAECLGDACQGAPVAPNDPTPASAGFQGAGNLREAARERRCPRAKRAVRHRGKPRCVTRKRAKKRGHANHTTRRHP